MSIRVLSGDSRDVLKTIADASIDSCVTDPPYALVSIGKRFGSDGAAPAKVGKTGAYARASSGFMGKRWDTGETAFDPEFWREVLRVLKPGAHLVAFGGTRTYHRLVCAIEDAGFEVRDQIAWIYGSGFPKSHDVSKGIDKRRDEDGPAIRELCRFIRAAMDARGLKSRNLVADFDGCNARLIDHWAARDTDSQPSLPTAPQWAKLKAVLDFGDQMDPAFAWLDARKGEPSDDYKTAAILGEHDGQTPGLSGMRFVSTDKTIRERSPEAAAWEGWGTALKPALEPVVLARKPLQGTVASNVLAHGTGALNIDASRIETGENLNGGTYSPGGNKTALPGDERSAAGKGMFVEGGGRLPGAFAQPSGRWPANVIHDGSNEVEAAFPWVGPGSSHTRHNSGEFKSPAKGKEAPHNSGGVGDASGTAARFFYSAKADAEDRLGSKHPTVKPVDLMAYLCRLVTPAGGTVLDPFAGTGTTGLGAMNGGFDAILIEREPEYVADIERRLAWARGEGRLTAQEMSRGRSTEDGHGPLFATDEKR